MTTVPRSNVLDHLKQFRFERKGTSLSLGQNNEGEEENHQRSNHEMSESEVESEEEGSRNCDLNKPQVSYSPKRVDGSVYKITDDKQKTNSENKTVTTNGVIHVLSDSSDSDKAENEEHVKTEPKKYSRIRTFINSAHTSKRKKTNSSDSDTTERDEDEISTANQRKAPKRVKRNDSDDEHWSDFVYASSEDDSDTEVSNYMSESQKRVFDFLNTAPATELLLIQSCTEKKASAIIFGRPYEGWRDLVNRLNNGKGINTQILNHTLDGLKTRSIVSKLMNKCLDLAISTEEAIAAGSSILEEQPTILTPSLKLMPYQLVGLNWLAVMHSQQLNGILADEMGLGKTIQVIAFFGYLKQNGLSTRPHLVVAPTTTLDNWAIEFTRWCPDLRLAIYHGSPDERRELRVRWFKDKFSTMDVIITTYKIVANSPEERKMFRIMPLEYVVFDEAHMLKNMNTQRYFYLFNINAQHRILLTGTPLQNNLLELMSLLNFVMPGMFAANIQYIKAFFSKNGKLPVNKLPDFEKEQIERAKRIMKPFFLRRLKVDVLKNLPTKTNSLIHCPLHEEQKNKYDELVMEVKSLSDTNDSDYNYMASFMQLRKLANHPLALRYHYKNRELNEIAQRLASDYNYKQNNKDYIYEDLQFMSDHEIHKLAVEHKCISRFKLNDSAFLKSGKFEKLDELLPKLKEEGHRVVMFSQFIFILDIIEDYMRIRGHNFLRLDGTTKSLDRQELIDNYNEDDDIFVFLLSTRAGGVGINLTSADTVIIHDVDFNPYNDKQAEDRCHRLGQTRPVNIVRLISEGTVEETIYAKAKSKLELEQEIIGNGDDDTDVELLLKEALGFKVSSKTCE
ncbi:SWI/SNF-related matrix-associated actin-dependent regulator of chromatin subfamily A containing DEAD/H box 1 homolog isoform X2 [Rhodnius prolixus]|uniref:SWI/SNF-related matrix-associated actin-dependent regulator of chromatin subfamily A containing DEAD/H box 1 homolog isoform X2 n=1 Tax=Rhodnius prolixus TaxID=13249 RepID=UPI003D18DB63